MLRKPDPKALILDDDPERAERFLRIYPAAVWVTTSHECIEKFSEFWDIISLDHDLGGETFVDSERKDCGMEVVRWLAENQPAILKKSHFIVHSLNADAAMEMVETLRSIGYKCTYRPFIFMD